MKDHGIVTDVLASDRSELARQFSNRHTSRNPVKQTTVGITRHMGVLPGLLAVAVALVLAIGTAVAQDDDEDEIPFEEAHIFFELNDTDGDLGIHALIDGEPWKRLEIEDPQELRMLNIYVNGRLRRQGLTEIFFESAEPPFDELLPEKFFLRFPEGTYEIEGVTLEGKELESEVEITHVLPAPPGNIKVSRKPVPEDCDKGPVPSVDKGKPVIISWDPVTHSHPEIGRRGERIEVIKYQLVVEREEPTLLVFSVDLPPSETRFQVEVPSGFIALGEEFKFEILVREKSFNQTAVESCFVVE